MGKQVKWPSKDQIYDLYITQNLRRSDVAKLYNISESLVKKILKTFDIKKDKSKINELCAETCLTRYGVNNAFKLNWVIEKAHTPEVEDRRKKSCVNTCLNRYGTTNGGGIPSSIEKIKSTTKARYGVDFYICVPEIREKSLIPEARKKALNSTIEHNRKVYNVDYWWQSEDYKRRFRSPEQVRQYKIKEIQTKKKNKTINSSKPEEDLYINLCTTYGKDNVVRQYKDDRYPFNCDFYIKSDDLFIELNYYWTHGDHPFNEQSIDDLNYLNWIKSKQGLDYKGRPNCYYKFEEGWTKIDPLKIHTAKINKINYKAIYKKCILTIKNGKEVLEWL